MIIEMARIRVLGPRPLLGATIRALQDRGIVHLVDAPAIEGLRRSELDAIARRRRHHLTRALGDVERAIDGLERLGARAADRPGPPPPEGRTVRLAARVAAEVEQLAARARALADERDALAVYEPLFAELAAVFANGAAHRSSVFLLRLRTTAGLDALRAALERSVMGGGDPDGSAGGAGGRAPRGIERGVTVGGDPDGSAGGAGGQAPRGIDRTLGEALELRTHALASGETVLLLLVPAARAAEVERTLTEARVERAPLPPALVGGTLSEALPRLQPRLAEVVRELAMVRDDAAALARAHGDDLARARRGLHDALLALEAEGCASTSARAFVLEGWLPARDRALVRAAAAGVSPELAVEDVAREQWQGDDAPVVLANPPLFAPFEVLTRMLPLPRYGTMDPTPFVAVFFPMLFGVVVGDVGYGLAIAAIASALWLSGPRTRDLARIAAAVAIYTIVFGVLYGELFGDLGSRWFGMQPLWFDRREAVLGFLILAIALGVVHLVLGLVVAAISRWRRDKREAIGRGLTSAMLLLVVVALLALFERLPGVLVQPAVIAILVLLPVIVVLEGATALLDFMTIVGHVLSYARVMALGTASVMLAVVANRMHGAFASAAIGIAFALVFHLVNFAITLFSPTIHVLRLHYVEFFGTFFEPGGGPYRPLRHWSPGDRSGATP